MSLHSPPVNDPHQSMQSLVVASQECHHVFSSLHRCANHRAELLVVACCRDCAIAHRTAAVVHRYTHVLCFGCSELVEFSDRREASKVLVALRGAYNLPHLGVASVSAQGSAKASGGWKHQVAANPSWSQKGMERWIESQEVMSLLPKRDWKERRAWNDALPCRISELDDQRHKHYMDTQLPTIHHFTVIRFTYSDAFATRA